MLLKTISLKFQKQLTEILIWQNCYEISRKISRETLAKVQKSLGVTHSLKIQKSVFIYFREKNSRIWEFRTFFFTPAKVYKHSLTRF